MCLLVTIRAPNGSLLLAANRDESYARPTRQPFVWDRTPRILAGRDEQGGGTWLAVNEHGVVAAVTNRPTSDGEDASRPTRGNLPLLACSCRTAPAADQLLRAHLRDQRYNGFNLFVGDRHRAFVVQAPGGAVDFTDVPPGTHVVGNTGWDERADLRVARARELLARLPAGAADWQEGLAALMALCRDHQVLRDGSSLCLHAGQAGTVSSTILLLSPAGRLMRYLHAPGPPCRTEYGALGFRNNTRRISGP